MRVSSEGLLHPDPSVKGVMRFLEPDGPKRLVKDLAACVAPGANDDTVARGTTGSGAYSAGKASVRVVKQRIGQRAVLCVRFEEQASGWIVKLTRKKSEMQAPGDPDGMREAADRAGVAIPLPVGVLPRFRAVVFPELPGVPLTDIDAGTAGALGESLARLHSALPLPENRCGRAFEEIQVARARERGLLRYRPDLRARHDAALNRWWSFGMALSPERDTARVPCHGDFHTGQVLVTRTAGRPNLAILDWDMHCAAEAERDAGNLLADLALLEALGEFEGIGTRREVQAAFLRGYRSVRELDGRRLDWYATGSLLRLAALYADLDFGRGGPARRDVAERLLAGMESRPPARLYSSSTSFAAQLPSDADRRTK